jgi:hypothetical protein
MGGALETPQRACRLRLAYSSSGMDRRGQRATGVAQTGSHVVPRRGIRAARQEAAHQREKQLTYHA